MEAPGEFVDVLLTTMSDRSGCIILCNGEISYNFGLAQIFSFWKPGCSKEPNVQWVTINNGSETQKIFYRLCVSFIFLQQTKVDLA